ncbi:MAG: ATP-binding protein, partial [Burkholderiaceae bacterium]|nr:ATP-binding protein [Burkholderiaceae bacterium]
MKTVDAKDSPSQIQRLCVLRWISAGSQALMLTIAVNELGMALHLGPVVAVVLALVAFNLFAAWRSRRPWLVTDAEVFGHLCVDIVALTLLLYFSGGATNPFVSLLLLPLTIAAVMLPGRYAWATAGLTLGAYSLLMFTHVHWSAPPRLLRFVGDVFPGLVQLTSEHAAHSSSSFGLHLLGTWFNFLVSALIIAFFVVRMATALRQRNADLALAREEALRSEQVLGLGTFAAGAAHQLGTPLSTMAVVVSELDRQIGRRGAMSSDLKLLRQQIENCKKILSDLLGAAGQARSEEGGAKKLDLYIKDVVAQWQLLRPSVPVTTMIERLQPAPYVVADRTLEQALINLLDNAADASPQSLEVQAWWDQTCCRVYILNRGGGIAAASAPQVGQPFFTTKTEEGGLGIGV